MSVTLPSKALNMSSSHVYDDDVLSLLLTYVKTTIMTIRLEDIKTFYLEGRQPIYGYDKQDAFDKWCNANPFKQAQFGLSVKGVSDAYQN